MKPRKRAKRPKGRKAKRGYKNPAMLMSPDHMADALGALFFGTFGMSAIRAVGLTPLQAMVALAKAGAKHKEKPGPGESPATRPN